MTPKPVVKKVPIRSSSSKRRKITKIDCDPPPRPAFNKFELEKDWVGKNLLRTMAMKMYGGSHAPDCQRDMWMLYTDAIGKPRQWDCTFDAKGEVTRRKKRVPIPPQDAAEELVKQVIDGVSMVGLLLSREPELCQRVARRLPHWPVIADLTAKNWKHDATEAISTVQLGEGIEGFLKSARTSDENPIRLYATAIYEALHGTRFEFKSIHDNKYRTADGCPEWAAKTVHLPRFTKSDVGVWMKLGKEMLLEQRPDFLEDPLLKEQYFKWKKRAANRSRNGKPTLRAIQNEAFGDFSKELKKLAPAENVYRGDW